MNTQTIQLGTVTLNSLQTMSSEEFTQYLLSSLHPHPTMNTEGAMDRYSITRSLLQQSKLKMQARTKVRDLAEQLHGQDLASFTHEFLDFPNLRRPMDRRWLGILGINIDDLRLAVECDAEHFDRLCEEKAEYHEVWYRNQNGLMCCIPLPRAMSEEEALECLVDLQRMQPGSYVLERKGLYRLYSAPGRPLQKVCYRPQLRIGSTHLRFSYAFLPEE